MHRQLTLIRHGALDTDLDGCYVGRLDVALSTTGHDHAIQLADRLTNRDIDALWCSPALRAQQTAAPIAQRLQQTCTIKAELHEVNFGRWEGMTFDQICADDPQRVQQWADFSDDFCFPDGESQQQFNQRILQLARLIHRSEESHLAIVTHGGVIRALLCQLLEWPPQDYLKFTIARGGYATLNLHDQHAVLTGLYNDF